MFHNSFHFTVTSRLKFSYNVGFNPLTLLHEMFLVYCLEGCLEEKTEVGPISNSETRNGLQESTLFYSCLQTNMNGITISMMLSKNNLNTFHQSNSKWTTLIMAPSCNGESIVETMVSDLLTERVAKLRSRLQLTLILPRH